MATQFHSSSQNDQRRKVRDSCNNCSAQKIRCGKQRPSCARCSTKGLECNYSYSQRTGRRTSTSTAQRNQLGPPSVPATANSPCVTGDTGSLLDIQTSMTPTTSPQVARESRFALDSLDDAYLELLDDARFTSTSNLDLTASPTLEPTSFSSSAIQAAESTDFFPFDELDCQWLGMPNDTTTEMQDAFKPVPTLHNLEQQQSGRKPSAKTYERGHDCMAQALRAVYNLNVMREPCHAATADPMSSIRSPCNEVRDVDTVLFRNRDAAQTIDKILRCPCSADPSVSLACYLVTTKIVDWYGATIGAAGESSGEEGGGNTVLGNESLWGAMVERITARPIFMGKYRLDPEVQRAVRAQVVLSELKEHIQPLISRLPSYSISGLNAGRETSSSKDLGTNQTCVLRSQLRAVIQAARKPIYNADGH